MVEEASAEALVAEDVGAPAAHSPIAVNDRHPASTAHRECQDRADLMAHTPGLARVGHRRQRGCQAFTDSTVAGSGESVVKGRVNR